MPDIITPDTTLLRTFPFHEVTARDKWSKPWVLQPYLRADVLKFNAAPALDQATLSYEYGTGLREDDTAFRDWPPLALGNWYVRVEVQQAENEDPIVWHGVVINTRDRPFGGYSRNDGQFMAAGRQQFTCVGLGITLDREIVRRSQSVILSGESSQNIDRAVGWNLGRGDEGATARGPNGDADPELKWFHDNLADARTTTDGANYWAALDIVTYLLAYWSPGGNAADPEDETKLADPFLPFELDTTAGQTDHLKKVTPAVQADGRSVREILDELIHRRRLASYRIDVDEATNEARIVPFTFNEVALELADGTTIDANPRQKSLNFDAAVDVQVDTIVDHSRAVHQVIARGERRGAVCNLSVADGTLWRGWEDADQIAYNAAASGQAGYPSDFEERRSRNAAFRASDKLARVYSYFNLLADWDGKVGDGEGNSDNSTAWPGLTAAGEIDPNFPIAFWRAGLKLERDLPFLQGVDYSGGHIAAGTAASQWEAATRPETLPMLVLAKDKQDRWRPIEKLRDDNAADGYGFSCSARPQDDAAGFVLNVQGGPQHLIGYGDFTPADDSDNVLAELNWQQDIIAVAYILGDAHVEGKYPADNRLPKATDADLRFMVLNVRGLHLDFVPYKTIVGVEDGQLQRTEAGGFVRDDRDQLRAIARLAYAWYGTDRAALSCTYKQIKRLIQVGDLITELGTAPNNRAVRTVVTSVEYDLLRGQTSFATEFLDLDPALFSRR